MELIIGVTASLVASFVWFFLTYLIDVDGRRKIDYNLEIAINYARQFQYAIDYEDYYVALIQVDSLLNVLKEIHESIKPLTYLHKKKKLILTYIHNASYSLSIFKNVTVGYEEARERTARCARYRRKYLYDVHYDDEYSQPYLAVSLLVTQELNRGYSVKKALKDNLEFHGYSNERKIEIYLELVSALALKGGYMPKFDVRNQIYSYEEYKQYIQKKLTANN